MQDETYYNETTKTEETLPNLKGLNAEFDLLIEEANQLRELIATAKTSLKREYYAKKLQKIKRKVIRTLLAKTVENPELLKKTEEAASE